MTKARLEAFSDGVIAIIITIMVLELHTPHEASLHALLELGPIFSAYVLSFAFVGIYWNNHHHMLHAAHKIDGAVMWANLVLLFWLSLIPFTTAWLGEHPHDALPAALYGVVLFAAGMAYWVLERRLVHATGGAESVLGKATGEAMKERGSVVLYLSAIGLAFVSPYISDALYVVVAAMWLVPDRRIEQALAKEHAPKP
jgi:uncharacterized membrane protein